MEGKDGWESGEETEPRAEGVRLERDGGTELVSLMHFCQWDWVDGVGIPEEGELGKGAWAGGRMTSFVRSYGT